MGLNKGWYLIPEIDQLGGVPGVQFAKDGRRYEIHRTHLPLLSYLHPQAPKPATNLDAIHAARDERMAALGIKLRATQHTGADFILDKPHGALLGDSMRVGKGHPVGTLILTPKGFVPVETLRVGNEVVGANGLATRLTGVFRRGELAVFRVTMSDGTTVRVDGDHLWSVRTPSDALARRAFRTKATRELIGDLTQTTNRNRKWQIPQVAPVIFEARAKPLLDPYLLGVLLGDGSLTAGTPEFCPGDEDVPREVEKCLPEGIVLRRKPSKDRACTWALSRMATSGSNPLTDELRRLGLWGLASHQKFVPLEYLYASVEDRLALLQGLLDTDGEYGNVLAFSSSSFGLKQAVKFLVESLGGSVRESLRAKPKYTYKGEEKIGRPSYRLVIAMPDGFAPFRARGGYKPRTKFKPLRSIASIEPDGRAEVICLSVAAADQLYVTQHFIVTHNTLTSLLCHDPARGPLVIVAPLTARAVWIGWIRRLWPDADIGLAIGRKFNPETIKKPFIFIHYQLLQHWRALFHIGTLVFDEAHALTNRQARVAAAASLLASRSDIVIPMTGTPIWNMPPDLWMILALIAPKAFGSYDDFAERYGLPERTAHGTIYTGVSNEAELNARLSEIMIRRTWQDVGDAPPISRNVDLVDIDEAAQRKLDIIAGSLREDRANTAAHLASYRKAVSRLKEKAATTKAKLIASRNEPVVVWTWHVELAKKIALETSGFLLTGEQSVKLREEIIDRWRATPDGILCATMAVAQVAVDFSHAKHAIFAELDWTPAMIAQAEMRTFHPSRAMAITFIILDHVVDRRMIVGLEKKLAAASPVGVGAADDAITTLRLAMFGEKDEGDMARFLDDLLASAGE